MSQSVNLAYIRPSFTTLQEAIICDHKDGFLQKNTMIYHQVQGCHTTVTNIASPDFLPVQSLICRLLEYASPLHPPTSPISESYRSSWRSSTYSSSAMRVCIMATGTVSSSRWALEVRVLLPAMPLTIVSSFALFLRFLPTCQWLLAHFAKLSYVLEPYRSLSIPGLYPPSRSDNPLSLLLSSMERLLYFR